MVENTNADYTQEIAKLKPRYNNFVQVATELKIVNEETKKQAIDLIRELNLLTEQFQKAYDYFMKPVEDHVKKVKKDFRPFFKKIEEIVGKSSYDGLRGQLSDYETKQAEARRIEEEKLRKKQQEEYNKQVKKADKAGEIASVPPPPAKVEAVKEADVSYRDDFTFDEINYEIEKVPEVLIFSGVTIRLKSLDKKAVQKLIDLGAREIPGIKIFCKKIPIIRETSIENL